jgi:hypothetical protein
MLVLMSLFEAIAASKIASKSWIYGQRKNTSGKSTQVVYMLYSEKFIFIIGVN